MFKLSVQYDSSNPLEFIRQYLLIPSCDEGGNIRYDIISSEIDKIKYEYHNDILYVFEVPTLIQLTLSFKPYPLPIDFYHDFNEFILWNVASYNKQLSSDVLLTYKSCIDWKIWVSSNPYKDVIDDNTLVELTLKGYM